MKTNFKQLGNLDEMKLMRQGNPMKIAEYAVKKREFEQIKSEHFNEEFPFVNGFGQSYLDELKTYADANPDDQSAKIRYELQRERYNVQEANKTFAH